MTALALTVAVVTAIIALIGWSRALSRIVDLKCELTLREYRVQQNARLRRRVWELSHTRYSNLEQLCGTVIDE